LTALLRQSIKARSGTIAGAGGHEETVRQARRTLAVVFTLLVGAVLVRPTAAEDVEKKFRVSASVGMYNVQDGVHSDAANRLILLAPDLEIETLYRDPRNDSAAFGNLEIKPGAIVSAQAQYAMSKIFLIEASAGYQKTDVGDVEVQSQFLGLDLPDIERVHFYTFHIPVGEIEEVPVQLTFLGRFRPRSSLNPYFGAGFGYVFQGFQPSSEFNTLSTTMDSLRGGLAVVSPDFPGDISLANPSETVDLAGATVDIRDTWEWHLAAGMEYSFKRKWAAFFDMRYSFAARSMEIGFNGGTDLGIAVPNYTTFSGRVPETFGPILIASGGLVDGGRMAPSPDPARCEFVLEPDGVNDPGYYYAQGGKVKYDAFSLVFGVRYTF
jgi:outer membrane protein with beta-barrel domain